MTAICAHRTARIDVKPPVEGAPSTERRLSSGECQLRRFGAIGCALRAIHCRVIGDEAMSNSDSGEAKAVVRRNTEEVQGRGNFDVFEELFDEETSSTIRRNPT